MSRKPKAPAIQTFSDLYQHAVGERQWLGPFLAGHLMVEFLLRRLVAQYDPKLTLLADKMRHFELIELNSQISAITEQQRDVLVAINKVRNKLAHQITYEPTIVELKAIWQVAADAFSDMTDGISQGLGEMEVKNNVTSLDSWVFSELFIQIAYDLHDALVELGGDEESF